MRIDPNRYATALLFALEAHGFQVRKGTDVPYITHPVAVSATLAQYGYPEELVLAGLLYDTMEDAGVSFDELAARFGPRVAALVAGVSEEKERSGARVPWRERKEAQLRHFREADRETVALKAADTLHNVASILRDWRICGERVWERFSAPREEQVWYYAAVAERVRERLGDGGLAGELGEAVDRLRMAGG